MEWISRVMKHLEQSQSPKEMDNMEWIKAMDHQTTGRE